MIINNLFIFILLTFVFSLAIDVLIGELPTKIHPVVYIGKLIEFNKNIFIKIKNKSSGLYVVICVYVISSVIIYLIYYLLSFNELLLVIIYSILLSSTYSIKMLLNTAVNVKNDLNESIEKARKSVSYLVSRNTDELTEAHIVSATIESMTENITDSYIAPVFYFFVFSIVFLIFNIKNAIFYLILIAFIYRISNTLDAMLGYKTDELKFIGFIPAKIDDALNYIPARIAGFTVVISSFFLKMDWRNSYKIMKRDARNCPSPNSGFTMAPTAGALNIQLVKRQTYILGDNTKEINVDDISKAVKLSKLTIFLFTVITLLIFISIGLII